MSEHPSLRKPDGAVTPPELTIHSYEQDSQVVLVLRGELDIASAPVFAHAIAETLEQSTPGVLLDISAVEFVDSTGLRAILAARALCVERSRTFALTPARTLGSALARSDRRPRRAASRRNRWRPVQHRPAVASAPL